MDPNVCHDQDLPVDPRVHRRLLRYLNQARVPEHLMVAPHDRRVGDEDAAHSEHVEHHPKEKQILDRDLAARLICERDRISPLHGFAHIKDVLAIEPRIRERLRDIILSFGPATYGRWDLLYDLEVGGAEVAIEHAALLRTYEVVFLADGTDTVLWDPSDETTPSFTRLSGANEVLSANLLCCGHSVESRYQAASNPPARSS